MTDSNNTVEQDNAIALAARTAYHREVRDAFIRTFGAPGDRTPLGLVMLKYLEDFAGRGLPKTAANLDGATDIPRTFRELGRRDVMEVIHDAINWKEPRHEQNRSRRS